MTITDFGILDLVQTDFVSVISGTWGGSLNGYLMPLLLALVCLQFGMMAIEATISRDIPLVLMHVMLGIIRVGIVVAVFQHAGDWGNDIVQTFQQVGQNIGGFTPATGPSEVFDQGGQIAATIYQSISYGDWFWSPIQSLEYLLQVVFILAAWLVAALIYLGVLIEAALLVYAGPLVICITPLSWTFDLLILWGRTVLSVAFKVALILMTLAIGTALANGWIAAMNASTFLLSVINGIVMTVESVIFAYCVLKVPSRLSGMVAGAAVLGFGEAVADMAMGAVKGATGKWVQLAGAGISGISNAANYSNFTG